VDVSLEVVIVDDGSITECPELEVLRDRRVHMVRHTTSRGLSAARNTGMQVARGRWLAWLDDDDLWAPHKLAVQLDQIGTAVIVYGAAVIVDSACRVTARLPAPSTEGLLPALFRGNVIPAGSSNVMASAAAVRAVGGFDETLAHLQDWDMWLRLVRCGPAARCDDALVAYVLHGENMHLGVHDFMGEFDRFAAKHTAWAADIGLTFDRALFARYPAEVKRVLGYRRAAYWHILRHGLFPVTRKHVHVVAGFVLGKRVVRAYRRFRRHDLEADLGPLAEDPAWLDAFRGGELRLTAEAADETAGRRGHTAAWES
jgi:glycosyltransferase involved in cell wall biosynthesis